MNKKIILIFCMILLALPLINAASYSKTFNLWYLLVENVFGNLFLTYLGLVLLFVFIGALSRMNKFSIGVFLAVFTLAYGVGWAGAYLSFTIALIGFGWFIFAFINFWNSRIS
jgi:hypothetical protein